MFDVKLAPEEEGESHHRNNGAGNNEAGAEPVVFLAFIEHGLQRADSDHEQAEAPIIYRFAPAANLSEIRRVFDQAIGHDERQDTDRDVEEEDPAPTIVVDDPSPHGGPYGRYKHHRHAINGKRHGALLRRE